MVIPAIGAASDDASSRPRRPAQAAPAALATWPAIPDLADVVERRAGRRDSLFGRLDLLDRLVIQPSQLGRDLTERQVRSLQLPDEAQPRKVAVAVACLWTRLPR